MRNWINKLKSKLSTGKLVAFVAICLVAVLLVGVSIAWFTSQINLTGSEFSTGTIEFKAYGYDSNGKLVTTIYPEGKIPEGETNANGPLFSDKDMHAGSVSTAFIAIENSGTLDLEYRLSFSVSEHQSGSDDDLVYLGGYWYLLTDVTNLVTDDIVSFAENNKATACNETNCPNSVHTCTEKNGSKNLSTISQHSSSGIINANSGTVHYYRLDYGVRADASSNEYSGRKFAVIASVYTSQVGAIDDEAGFGVTRQVSSAEDLDKAIDQALPGDTILLLNNITYNGDLVINKCINFEAGGKTLTVNGNMIYDFVSTLPLKINLQGKGTIKVLASGAVGGNFTISAPKSQVELIGGNTEGDLLVGRFFTVDATNDAESGGCIFSDIVVLDGEGKDAKAVYVRSNTKITVSAGVTLERIEAAVQATNIEIQNAGQINQVLLSSMFLTSQTDAPQIYIHNYNRIFNVVLPTWSVPFVKDADGNYSGNTRIVVSAGGVIDSLTGSDYFNSTHIEDEDADLYVEQIVSGSDKGLRVYYRNLPDQANTTLQAIIKDYFNDKGITDSAYTAAIKAIDTLEIICRGDKVITTADFTFVKTSLTSLVSLDMSQSAAENNTIPSEALRELSTLKNVELPRSVKTIGQLAFYGTSVKGITVPATVTNIGNSAFASTSYVYMQSYEPCTLSTAGHGNTYFFVPEAVLDTYKTATNWKNFETKIYPMAQLADDGVTHVRKLADGTYEIVHYIGTDTELTIGEGVSLDGTTLIVSSVGDGAYRHIKQTYTLNFYTSVNNISNYAFYNTKVNGIINFSNIKTVGNYAFEGCATLTAILEGNTIESVGVNAFYGCVRLYQVVLPDVQTVGNSAFANTPSLLTITFGDKLSSLASGQFVGSLNLREITFKNPTADAVAVSSFFNTLDKNLLSNLRVYVPVGSYSDYVAKFTPSTGATTYLSTLCEDGEMYGTNEIAIYYNNAHIGTVDIGQFRLRDMGADKVSISSCNVSSADIADSDFWSNFDSIPETLNGKTVVRIGPASYRSVPFSLMTKATNSTLNPWGNNNISFPDTVTEIGVYAFYNTDVSFTTLPAVETIGANAFEGATKVYYVNAPELLNIEKAAFKSATGLRQFKAEKLISVGVESFSSCTNLIRLYVPSLPSVTDTTWLNGATNLAELWIAINATTSPSSMPTYSTHPKAIILTGVANTSRKQYVASKVMLANVSDYSVTDENGTVLCVLEGMAEYWVIEDTSDAKDGTVSILNHFPKTAISSTITIPGSVQAVQNGNTVTVEVISLGIASFMGTDFGGNSVAFASTIKELKQRAFYNNATLAGDVKLNSVETLGLLTFSSTGITSISGPSVKTIGNTCFEYCALLKSVSFPRLVTVANYAFKDCTSLESIYLEDVTTFNTGAFLNDKKLTNITINRVLGSGEAVPSIKGTYDKATYKFEFYVPSASIALYQVASPYLNFPIHALDTVMTNADGNYSLVEKGDGWEILSFAPIGTPTSLTVPASHEGKDILFISSSAFSLCTSVTTIVLPASYCYYQYGTFNGMIALQNVDVANGSAYYKSVDGVLFTANGKELVYYPGRKTATSYNVPSGVEIIQSHAFEGATVLESIVVPADVTVIGYEAFNGVGIKSITFEGAVPPYLVDTNVFNVNTDGFTIYVPTGSGDTYKNSNSFIKYEEYIVEN